MTLNKLTGEALVDGTLDSDAIGTASVTHDKLHSNIISSQTVISTVDASNDLLLIYDNDTSSLKKVSISSVRTTNTDGLTEGSANLYFTNARADARISNAIKDEDNMASNSATHIPSQQSVKAYVDTEVAGLVDSAPSTLDTLNELAAALGDDANFSTTITTSIATKLPLAGGTLTGNLSMENTDAGSAAGPEFVLFRNSASAADADYLGQIKFDGKNDAGQSIVYAKITGKILDASDGTEDGIIEIAHKKAGSNNISARFRSDSLQLINGTNLTVAGTTDLTGDLTVDTNTFKVDTSNNRVGIGTSSPSATLQVVGTTNSLQSVFGSDSSGLKISTFQKTANDAGVILDAQESSNGTLTFATTGTERMRIDSSGNLLVGTTTNTYDRAKLTVFGEPGAPATSGTSTTNVGLRLATTTGNSQAMDLGIYNAAPYGGWIQASNSGGLNNTSPIAINPNGGNVAIGTTGPVSSGYDTGSTKLTVMSTTLNNATSGYLELASRANSNGYNAGAIQFNNFENAGVAGSGVQNRTVGQIRTVIATTDSNAGDDSGGTMEFWTKPEAGSLARTMVIHSDGKVGIGTATPTQILHVEGDIRLGSGNASRKIVFGSAGTANDYIELIDVNSSANMFNLVQDGNSKLVVQGVTGYVGIGTNGPVEPLDLRFSGRHGIVCGSTSGSGSYIVLDGAGNGDAAGSDYAYIEHTSSGNLNFNVGNGSNSTNTKMLIEPGGNVGVGLGDPAYKLDIGGIGATQLRLKSSGDTGYTQGAMIIESSDSSSNPGNRGQGVYYYNVPNQRTWYTGTLYNNGNKFGFGYRQVSGFQDDAADNLHAVMVIDGDSKEVGIGNTNPSATLHVEDTVTGGGNSGHMKVGHTRTRTFYAGISSSETRWYKVLNYGSGNMFTGKVQIYVTRSGGYNQTGAHKEYRASLGGYSNSVYGPLSLSGDGGEGGVASLEVGTDAGIYLRVNSSIYGGTVYVTFSGQGGMGWAYSNSSYSTSLP